MAYNSAHTGPEIDAAVRLLGQIQDARDSTRQDRLEVKNLADQVKIDASQVSAQTETVTAKASQVLSSAAAVEQARSEVADATAIAQEAKDHAAASSASARESQTAASASEQAAAQSQLAAGLSEQVSAESAAEAASAAERVAEDRIAAAASAARAATSAQNAEAVVSGGTASVTPGAGLIPLADAHGKINAQWMPDDIARSDAVEAAAGVAAEAAEAAAESRSRTDSFLLPSPESPSARDNGRPLQAGDRYFNTVDQAEYLYKSDGWEPNDSLLAISELELHLLSAQGASKIGSIVGSDGGVYRSQASINADRLTAKDFGLLGDGSDETPKIVAFLAAKAGAGKSYLQRDKIYGFTGQLDLMAGLDLVTNGSTFRRLSTAGSYGIRVHDDVKVDNLRLSTPGGPAEGGTEVIGSRVKIGRYKFTSDVEDCGVSSARNALYVHDANSVQVDRTYINNHSKPLRYLRTEDTVHGFTRANAATTGLYCTDTKRAIFKGGRIFGKSPSASGSAGQNAVLIESTIDLGTQDVRVIDWDAEDSPEHGYRVGGNYQVDNVHLVRCISRRAGSGSSPTGGSGFKALGPNGRGVYHTNIYLTGCVSEDAGQVPGENFNALDLSWIDGFQVEGFISRKRSRPYASTGGIRLSRLRNGVIDSPVVRDPLTGALIFLEVDGDTGVAMESVTISGGIVHRADFDVITMNCKSCTYRNVIVDGLLVLGGRAAVRAEIPASGGAYIQVQMRISHSDPKDTTGGPAITGSNDILYVFTGLWYGSFGASGKDGSTYTDTTNGIIRTRRGGNWISPVETIGGTWSPGLTNITNADSVTGNTCQYIRVGNVVTFSGVLQIKPTGTGIVTVDISTPVSALFTGFSQASGTARSSGGEISGTISANAASGSLSLALSATSTTNRNVAFHGMYRIP